MAGVGAPESVVGVVQGCGKGRRATCDSPRGGWAEEEDGWGSEDPERCGEARRSVGVGEGAMWMNRPERKRDVRPEVGGGRTERGGNVSIWGVETRGVRGHVERGGQEIGGRGGTGRQATGKPGDMRLLPRRGERKSRAWAKAGRAGAQVRVEAGHKATGGRLNRGDGGVVVAKRRPTGRGGGWGSVAIRFVRPRGREAVSEGSLTGRGSFCSFVGLFRAAEMKSIWRRKQWRGCSSPDGRGPWCVCGEAGALSSSRGGCRLGVLTTRASRLVALRTGGSAQGLRRGERCVGPREGHGSRGRVGRRARDVTQSRKKGCEHGSTRSTADSGPDDSGSLPPRPPVRDHWGLGWQRGGSRRAGPGPTRTGAAHGPDQAGSSAP